MKWRVVAFKHPEKERSVLYHQDVPDEDLLDSVKQAVERGANLLSIRGFTEKTTKIDFDVEGSIAEAREVKK